MSNSRWTIEEKKLLRAFYPHSHRRALLLLFPGWNFNSIRHKANKMGITRTKEFVRMWERMNLLRPEYGRTRKNYLGYIEVLRNGKWQRLARVVWEEHYGPIPPGHNITYIDGDKDNVCIDNLKLVSRQDALKLVSLTNYPQEIREAYLINKKIRKLIDEQR